MQALRAQMNPHFIFNCLSSINRFILKNEIRNGFRLSYQIFQADPDGANNSKNPFISLEDELEMLRSILILKDYDLKILLITALFFKTQFDVGMFLFHRCCYSLLLKMLSGMG